MAGGQGTRACVRSAMPGTLGGSNEAEIGGPMTPICAVDACGARNQGSMIIWL